MARGNLQLARLHFLIALKKDPASTEACTAFGAVQALAGDAEKAEMAYEAALTLITDTSLPFSASAAFGGVRGIRTELWRRWRLHEKRFPTT